MRHPHHGSRFCMSCGEMTVAAGREGSRECPVCGFAHRLHPRPCAAGLPVRDGRFLLVRRDIEPRRGLWQVPGGFMELGESPAEAAARELREEALLETGTMRLLGVYTPVVNSLVVIAYEAEALNEGGAGHETQEVRWFRPEETPWDELSFSSSEFAIRDWMRRNGLAVPGALVTTWGG